MKILDFVSLELKNKYKEFSKEDGVSLTFAPDVDVSLSDIFDAAENCNKRKKNRIELVSLIPSNKIFNYGLYISSDKVNYSKLYIALNKKNRNKHAIPKVRKYLTNSIFKDNTGIYKIDLSNGNFVMYGKWFEGAGKTRDVKNVLVGKYNDIHFFLKIILGYVATTRSKPKLGIYSVEYNHSLNTISYKKIENVPVLPVVHTKIKDIEQDVSYYFNNVSKFQEYGMAGLRKVLLVSEPGTGKTTFLYKLALQYKDKFSVVYCDDIVAAAKHISAAAKYNIPTLVFLEDADSTMSRYRGQAPLLNFLDGIDTPKNSNGHYIIMTTNFPDLIEDRILKRPGRIDKIILFGALENQEALECAKIYFKDIINLEEFPDASIKLFSGKTGAQIKELANASRAYAASQELKVDLSLISKVSNEMYAAFDEVSRYADKKSLKQNSKSRIGFINPAENQVQEYVEFKK